MPEFRTQADLMKWIIERTLPAGPIVEVGLLLTVWGRRYKGVVVGSVPGHAGRVEEIPLTRDLRRRVSLAFEFGSRLYIRVDFASGNYLVRVLSVGGM